MNLPKVSIITIVRNDAAGFLVTARSILNQDYPNLEWVVVDGASTDGTMRYVLNLAPRIARYVSEPDSGIYDAMNKGICMASGDWIFFLNADDVFFESNTVSKYIRHIRPDDDILYSDVIRREDGQIHIYRPNHQFWAGMIFDHQSACVRADIYKTLGYRDSFRIAGDFDFFSRARVAGKKARKISWLIGCRKPFASGASSNYVARQEERIKVIRGNFPDKRTHWKALLISEYNAGFLRQEINENEHKYLLQLIEN